MALLALEKNYLCNVPPFIREQKVANLGNHLVSSVVFSLEHGGHFNLLDTIIFALSDVSFYLKEGGGGGGERDKKIQKF